MIPSGNNRGSSLDEIALVLEAIAFASRRHQGQLRKDRQTPYASHVFRVAMIVRHLFRIDDPQILAAAVLHDTIEDTPTDYDDIAEAFGAQVADWVAALSKNTRLPDEAREAQYCEALTQAPWQVQVCKLADMTDNLIDSAHLSPNSRSRTQARIQGYLDAIAANLRPEAQEAWETVKRLLDER